ncbi:hypothetical protein M1770_05575 [Spiroplasma citri]|nr:hypothetical protein [Spiroplasma citri]WFG97527.1 hypothetical protein M1770_05575 [Spiroplasma citri]
MKTLQDMMKDLTGIDVEQNKISKYLESEKLIYVVLIYKVLIYKVLF